MITNELEYFTAKEAVKDGLIESIKSVETKIAGSYEIFANGGFDFNQRNFVFKDKLGNLRVGRFKDGGELLTFVTELSTNMIKEEAE